MFKIFNDIRWRVNQLLQVGQVVKNYLAISVDWKDEKRKLLLTGIQSFMEDDLM